MDSLTRTLECIDRHYLARSSSKVSQLIAMLSDFVPEALALGATYLHSQNQALLLAIIIAAQNLPEGFNAFHELNSGDNKWQIRRLTGLFAGIAFLGPVLSITGYETLAGHDTGLGVIMLFSGGGIVYLLFRDIAPQAVLERHYYPSLGVIIGFLTGMIGHMLVGG